MTAPVCARTTRSRAAAAPRPILTLGPVAFILMSLPFLLVGMTMQVLGVVVFVDSMAIFVCVGMGVASPGYLLLIITVVMFGCDGVWTPTARESAPKVTRRTLPYR